MDSETRIKLLRMGLEPLGDLLQRVIDTDDGKILMTGSIVREGVW